MSEPQLDHTAALLKELSEKEATGDYAETRIKTDERVIARITDGIYRQPGSALRELVANAYDADATLVTIETDYPRFDKVVVRDNGRGLSKATLAHVLHHIGGSAKRTQRGKELEMVDPDDVTHSTSGRRLIGKIGIGLFSVAQLTPHFQIISKVKGERFRRVADVLLTTYTEEKLAGGDGGGEFDAGTVSIWSVPADDVDTQGTDIVLMDLKAQAKSLLRSRDIWTAVREAERDGEGSSEALRGPLFHIGEVDLENGNTIERTSQLPWTEADAPATRFLKLVQAVMASTADRSTPRLAHTVDNYLHMLWSLGLSLPLQYVREHPLERELPRNTRVFSLANVKKGQAIEKTVPVGESLSTALSLESVASSSSLPFTLIVDGVEIRRPISLSDMPDDPEYALKDRLLFVGSSAPDLSKVPERFRGGTLKFEAYFYWCPKIVPKDHNGVLVRVNGASGTLFDETFMKYQVSEQTRLRQIIAEVFVIEGLDAALNIDRESFNYAHPHYLYLQRWVHEALRQLTNVHKRLASETRKQTLAMRTAAASSELEATVAEEWATAVQDELASPPKVVFTDAAEKIGNAPSAEVNTIVLHRAEVLPTQARRTLAKLTPAQLELEQKLVAIAQILSAYGVFEGMPKTRQAGLIRAIGKVIKSGSGTKGGGAK